MVIQLHQWDLAVGFTSFKIPKNKYAGFLVLFEGTCQDTLTKSEFGWLRTTEQGRQIDFIDFDRLAELDDQCFGCAEATFAAGTFDFGVYLPKHVMDDDANVWEISDIDNCYFEVHTALSANFTAGAGTVFGVIKNGIEGYTSKLTNYDLVYAIGHNTERLVGFENIYALFVENHADIDRIMMSKDGKTIYDATDDALESTTHLFTKKEAFVAAVPYLWLPMALTGTLEEMLSDNISLTYDTNAAAGSPNNMVVWSIDFPTTSKYSRSVSEYNAATNKVMAAKAAAGKTRPLTIIGNVRNLTKSQKAIPAYATKEGAGVPI